jgi:hypothetical protein
MELPISMETYQQLVSASVDCGFEKEMWEIGAEAIRDWLVRNAPDSFGKPVTSGYQWKDVFLPAGTLLRTIYQGKNYHSIVEDDYLLFQGNPMSPSRFANSVGNGGRNAWNVIWVLLPESRTWQLAATLSKKKTDAPESKKKPRRH